MCADKADAKSMCVSFWIIALAFALGGCEVVSDDDVLEPSAQSARLATQLAPPMETLLLSATLHFAPGTPTKAKVNPIELTNLRALIVELKSAQSVQSIKIVAHSDGAGSRLEQERVAQQRAAFVQEYLVENGISLDVVTVSLMGNNAPVVNCSLLRSAHAQQCNARNRRVEVAVSIRRTTQLGN